MKLGGNSENVRSNLNKDASSQLRQDNILDITAEVNGDGDLIITTGSNNIINAGSVVGPGFVHYIGELYLGGIVVSVWKESGVEHGLVCSLSDLNPTPNTVSFWHDNTSDYQGTTDRYNGHNNDLIIAAVDPESESAVALSRAYKDGTWYLPAPAELQKIYLADFIMSAIDGCINLTNGFYWSSLESFPGTNVLCLSPTSGVIGSNNKINNYNVRAVKRF